MNKMSDKVKEVMAWYDKSVCFSMFVTKFE